jgi:Raf kinase inhibitor-like YbhB/YbcL family protein
MAFNISSTAFEYGARIPLIHTCDGGQISPPLQWDGEPKETVSFALILEDPDASEGTFTHWIIYNLPSDCHQLEKMTTVQKKLDNGAFQGKNDFGSIGYKGPCPPKGEEHRYFFRIYALKKKLHPESIKDGSQFHQILSGLVLDKAEYMGKFKV